MNYWMRVALKEQQQRVSKSEGVENWPPIGVTVEEWYESIVELEGTVDSIMNALMSFPAT